MAGDRKFTISGPGASDFLTSPTGEDLPGTSTSKGMSQTRGESTITNARNLEPALTLGKDVLSPEPAAGVPADAAPDRRTRKRRTTKKY